MIRDRKSPVDLARPRAVGEVITTALGMLGRHPVLLIGLGLAVVVPYELIVYAITNTAPLGDTSSAETAVVVLAVGFLLIGPLLSALYANALIEIGNGERPSISGVVLNSLRALPVVVAAEIIAGIGIAVGIFAFVIPGVILAVRLAVVSQVAALEGTDWPGALRRAFALTSGNGWRIFSLLLVVYLVNVTLTQGGAALAGSGSNVPQLIIGIAVALVEQAFQAVTLAILYFDLLARQTPV